MRLIHALFFIHLFFCTDNIYAVVGGAILNKSEIPRAIVHLKTMGNSGAEYCTGTLIDSKTVLTAAHCLGKSLRLIKKYKPTVEVSHFFEGKRQKTFATKYLVHPDYEKNEKADLALLFLDSNVSLEQYPMLSDVKNGDELHVLGFGLDGVNEKIDGNLRETFVFVKDIESRYFSSFNIANGPCSGDSGGAVYRSGTDAQEIVGVTYYVNPSLNEEQQRFLSQVNWDRSQLIERYPTVGKFCYNSTSYFMNITRYKDWIELNRMGNK